MIQETLQQPYDRRRWSELLASVFPQAALFQQPKKIEDALPPFVREGCQLGLVRLADGQNLAIFEIRVADHVNLQRNRVALRDFINRYATEGVSQGVLCVFNSSDPAYRFTFACKQTGFDDDGNIVTTETNPRRFTYILGPGETRRTAAQRFAELARRRDEVGMKQVIDAFSVERLNKEFFDRYKEHYQRFVTALTDSDAPARLFGITTSRRSKDYEAACKPVRDWVKKMLGRLVFLHFLQKKGWLGCPAGSKDWHGGDPRFLQKLFDDCPKPDRFYTTRLAPLFFDALNQPDRKGDVFALTGTRVPYLNGGLFEAEDARPDFSAQLFRDLLEFLASYNFTIDETDPEENEIGIDPEMLGHIFENLLEDNKDKGAYYTPKSIVQYMCQQSVLSYLRGHLGEHGDLDRLVLHKDAGGEHSWVRKNARAISTHLADLKACDPAIGSGAFPIGLLQEIFWIKLTLDPDLDPADTKRRIIQNSIYGVDIDPGAVEIARLRCWLALVVEEPEPQPLPNLEFNIFCADSLIEYVRGEPVNIARLAEDERIRDIIGRLVASKADFFTATRRPAKRKALAGIYDAIAALAQYEFTWLRNNQGLFGDGARTAELEQASQEVARVQKQLSGLRALPAAKQDAALDQIKDWFEDPANPTFLWQLHFGEVFARSGFDIIIANPPYVSVEKFSRTRLQEEWRKRFKTFASRGDIYCFFYELGLGLLRSGGHLCFISSNKFMRAGYGAGLRQLLAAQHLDRIIDFCELPVFDAGTDPCIIELTKAEPPSGHDLPVAVIKEEQEIDRLRLALEHRTFRSALKDLSAAGWSLEGGDGLAIVATMRSAGMRLREFVGGDIYRGILTGLNEAFVIDETTKRELIAKDKNSAKLIKRWIRGKDIKRWQGEWNAWYVIAFPFGFHPELKKFPAILAHLERHKAKLKARGQCTSSRSGGNEGQHHWLELDNNPSEAYLAGFNQPKVVFNETSKELHAYVDRDGYAINKTGFIILAEDPEYLLAIMMSSAMDFLYRTEFPSWGDPWAAGRIQFRGDRMAGIPIPPPKGPDDKKLSDLARQAAAAAEANNEAAVAAAEAQIDAIVYRLYGLDAADIAYIESRLPRRPNRTS